MPQVLRPDIRYQQTEQAAQRAVCQYLDLCGVAYCHVPNGGKRNAREAAIMSGLGVNPPPKRPQALGVAVELKRWPGGGLSEHQAAWLDRLERLGWVAFVSHGSGPAIDALAGLGFTPGRNLSKIVESCVDSNSEIG
jgi:hypothetical protein